MARLIGSMEKRGEPPPVARFPGSLLSSPRYALLWVVPRVVLGWLALQAGWSALQATPSDPGQGQNLLAFGLTLAGIALILGVFTAPAALIAGCVSAGMWFSENPAVSAGLLALVLILVLTWRTAGWIGLDRWVLPLLGLTGGGALVRRDTGRGRQ